MFSFDMHGVMPGNWMTPFGEVVNSTNITWGRLDQLIYLPSVIDGSARDAGNTGFVDTLRPGLLLGRVMSGTDRNKLIQWNPDATDGSQYIVAVLLSAQKMQLIGADQDRFVGYVLFGGNVKASGLCIPSVVTDGIVGAALEWVVRRQMNKSFVFDDMPQGYSPESHIQLVTADLTVTEAMAGTLFMVNGAANVTFTLPATPKRGLEYSFHNLVDFNLTLTCPTTDILVTLNDNAADTVALSTAAQRIGGGFKVFGTGTRWVVTPRVFSGQTVTATT